MFSKTLFILLIVNFMSHSYGQKAQKFFRKDYTYIESMQSFYKVFPVPSIWTEAKRLCAMEGATFWHPDNLQELQAVAAFWKKDKPNIPYLWSGLSDLLVEGRFVTVDGKPSSDVHTNWQFNTPNDANGNEDCTHLNTIGEMNDYICNTKYNFICKKTLQSLAWNHLCNMPNMGLPHAKVSPHFYPAHTGLYNKDSASSWANSGENCGEVCACSSSIGTATSSYYSPEGLRALKDYSFSTYTGKCYKLHTTPLNWTEANAVCQLEQSTLAVISNRSEASYLAKFTGSSQIPKIKGKYQRGIYHVGFHNRFNEGWRSVRGTPMNMEPEAWFDNDPPHSDFEECGAMFFDGRLVNTDCDMKSFFICEYVPLNCELNCLSHSV